MPRRTPPCWSSDAAYAARRSAHTSDPSHERCCAARPPPWRSSRTTDLPHRVLQLSAPRRTRLPSVRARAGFRPGSTTTALPGPPAFHIRPLPELFRTPRLCAAGADGMHIRHRTAPMPPRPKGGTAVGRVRGEHGSLGHGEDDGARRAGRDKRPRPLPSPQLVRLSGSNAVLRRRRGEGALQGVGQTAGRRIEITRARDSRTAWCRAWARIRRPTAKGVTEGDSAGPFSFGPLQAPSALVCSRSGTDAGGEQPAKVTCSPASPDDHTAPADPPPERAHETGSRIHYRRPASPVRPLDLEFEPDRGSPSSQQRP